MGYDQRRIAVMKVIIAGSRNFTDCDYICKKVDEILKRENIIPSEIISGGASGVDRCGEYYAYRREIPLKIFEADWNKFGRSAGPIRNAKMAQYADLLIAFTSGGRGTENMIETMEKFRKKLRVVKL